MRNGKCPTCGGTNVYSKAGGVGVSDDKVIHVYTGMISRAVPYVSFVCTSCGYFENYIADKGKLQEVEKTWQKVPV
jgi:predicted nucleic-acid-binding Zn-ribbon protein